jgi:hypothetical protein
MYRELPQDPNLYSCFTFFGFSGSYLMSMYVCVEVKILIPSEGVSRRCEELTDFLKIFLRILHAG